MYVCVSVRVLLYFCPRENKLNLRVFHFCIRQKVILAAPRVLKLSLRGSGYIL